MDRNLKDHFVLLSNLDNILTAYDLEGSEIDLNDQSYILDYYNKNIKETAVGKNQNPWLYWRGYGYIHQLDQIELSNAQLLQITELGLDIYLNELCIFYKNYRPIGLPLDTDSNQTYIQREYSHCVYEFDSTDNLRSYDIDSIEKFSMKYGISNIRIHTCHYGSEEYLKKQYPSLDFSSYNSCLPSLVLYINRLYNDLNKIKNVKKTFITPLWRYTNLRHMLASIMVRKDSYLSWYYFGSLDILKKNLWFDLENIDPFIVDRITSGCESLDKVYSIDNVSTKKPIELNGKNDLWKYPEGYDGYYIENILNDYYNSSFCAIVSESIFAQPFTTISEKTMIAMKCLTPFVVLGAPGTLTYLKNLGFKTFDKWWDESYDLEQNHYKRFQKIISIIDYIETLNINDTLADMQSVLEHNSQLVSSVETFQ
jgi:hypothetical protein